MHTNHIRNMEALFSPLSATSPSPPATLLEEARISSPPPAVHAAAARMLREAGISTPPPTSRTSTPPTTTTTLSRAAAPTAHAGADSVLANEDLLLLIIHHCIGADALRTYSTAVTNPTRASLRSVSPLLRRLIDDAVTSYSDSMRRGYGGGFVTAAMFMEQDDADGYRRANQAARAVKLFSQLRSLSVEFLNGAAVHRLLEAPLGGLTTLALPRGASTTLPLPRSWALRELDLSGCGQLSDRGLEGAALPSLERLRVTMNAKLSCPVLTSMPKLRVATLSVCSHLLDAAVTALCDGAPLLEELTLWRCASLRAPRIKGAELRLVNLCENALIDDEGAGRIGGACPKLQRLFLAGCAAVTSPLPNGGAHVAELDLANADGLTDGGLSAACAGAPALERLDISGCSLICQPEWLGGARLRSLRASGCDAIADDAITACCARSPGLTNLTLPLCAALRSPRIGTPALTELNLCGCAALTDAAVEHACHASPQLARLAVAHCNALVAPNLRGAAPRKIDLSHCALLTEPAVGGDRLEELSVAGCAALSDAALEAACVDAPHLVKLAIDGCAQLRCPGLRSPSVQVLCCRDVSDDLLAAVTLETFPALKKLKS